MAYTRHTACLILLPLSSSHSHSDCLGLKVRGICRWRYSAWFEMPSACLRPKITLCSIWHWFTTIWCVCLLEFYSRLGSLECSCAFRGARVRMGMQSRWNGLGPSMTTNTTYSTKTKRSTLHHHQIPQRISECIAAIRYWLMLQWLDEITVAGLSSEHGLQVSRDGVS